MTGEDLRAVILLNIENDTLTNKFHFIACLEHLHRWCHGTDKSANFSQFIVSIITGSTLIKNIIVTIAETPPKFKLEFSNTIIRLCRLVAGAESPLIIFA